MSIFTDRETSYMFLDQISTAVVTSFLIVGGGFLLLLIGGLAIFLIGGVIGWFIDIFQTQKRIKIQNKDKHKYTYDGKKDKWYYDKEQ